MSDILRAMQKRGVEPVPAVDVITLDGARIFPVPDDDQKVELTKVATRLVEFKPPQWGLVIAMASNVKGEGASFVSYSLARILAMNLGRRVLWIDANFRSPQPQLRHAEDDTLAQYLADPDAPPPKTGANWLSVMPGGPRVALHEGGAGFRAMPPGLRRFSFRIRVHSRRLPAGAGIGGVRVARAVL